MKTKDRGFNIPSREEFYRHYGGEIFAEDFNTTYRINQSSLYSPVALRIERDREREEMWIRIKAGSI